MVGYGRHVCAPLPARHPYLEPTHYHQLRRGPGVHIEPAEVVYVLVEDPAALTYNGHQPLRGPSTILGSYAVQLLDRLSG